MSMTDKQHLQQLHAMLSAYEDYKARQTIPPSFDSEDIKDIRKVLLMIENEPVCKGQKTI